MTVDVVITIAAGILAAVGLGGILVGAAYAGAPKRFAIFRAGSGSMAAAGIVLLLAGITGHADFGQMSGGLMLLIFGTAVSLPQETPGGTAPTV